MDKIMREALDKVSQGLRELAVVIDSALCLPDPQPVETKVATLSEAFDQLLSRVDTHMIRLEALESETKDLSERVDDLESSFTDRVDERIAERIGTEDIGDVVDEKVEAAVDDLDIDAKIDDKVREIVPEAMGDLLDDKIVETLNRVKIRFEV